MSSFLRYDRIQSQSYELNRVQDGVATLVERMAQSAFPWSTDGTLIEGVSLSTGANSIEHSLGRGYEGWLPVSVVCGGPPPTEVPGSSVDKARYIELYSPAPATLDLWIW